MTHEASLHIQIPNTLDGLKVGADGMREFLEKHDVAAETAFALDLTFEELITNTIKYAHSDLLPHEIEIRVSVVPDAVELEVCDDGDPFDPTAQEAPDTSLPVEERPIGGLGIHLIKNLTDAFEYRREEGKNRILVRKRRVGEM